MFNLPNIQGRTTEEKLQSLIEYTYQLVEELNTQTVDVMQICSEIERILKTDDTVLAGNKNKKALLEQKRRLQQIIKNIGG